jgi:predicted XRE-type DNA-binding protein
MTKKERLILSCHSKLTYKSIARIFKIKTSHVSHIMRKHGKFAVFKPQSMANIYKKYK